MLCSVAASVRSSTPECMGLSLRASWPMSSAVRFVKGKEFLTGFMPPGTVDSLLEAGLQLRHRLGLGGWVGRFVGKVIWLPALGYGILVWFVLKFVTALVSVLLGSAILVTVSDLDFLEGNVDMA